MANIAIGRVRQFFLSLTFLFCTSLQPIRGFALPASALGVIVVDSAGDAEQILAKLKSGEDFAALARKESIDATASDGGLIGVSDPNRLRIELREALAGVAVGQVTRVVKIPEGFAILKVLPAGGVVSENPTRILPLLATGAVKYTLSVSGRDEAESIFQALPRSEESSQDLGGICRSRNDALAKVISRLDSDTREVSSHPPSEQIKMDYTEAQLYAFEGDMSKAINFWETADGIVQLSSSRLTLPMEETLGVAYLHESEMENHIYDLPGDRCLFPSYQRFSNSQDSEKAVQYFLKYLKQKPDELEVKWLLNLAYMTLGKYPGEVPVQYLIPASEFASKEQVSRFTDVAPAAGLGLVSMAGGVIVDDFDNDGQLDVVISSMDPCVPLHFFHNNGDGTFTDRSAQAGFGDQFGGLNIVQADYNNDGCMDILVLRGGWEYPMRRSLLKNNCDGTFTDVTAASGLAVPATATQSAAWADIDNDGYLDLFIANERGPNQLFRNKGNGTFEDISHAAGIDQSIFTKGVTAADYDNDGFMDFYVSNFSGANLLYHNNRNGTFTEVGAQAGVQAPWGSFATWFFDYDNDGWPDLLVNSYYQSDDDVARTYAGLPHNAESMKLYKNMHDGTFKDVSADVGLDKVFMAMGANFGDIDNDGFLDIYLGNGNPSYGALIPHVLLRNHDGKYFADVTTASGTGELHKGHGVAFADVERSGFEDIFAQIGGAVPGDKHAFRLFQNPGNGNDWINVRLVGVKTNRAAIGAQIKLTIEGDDHQQRTVYRNVSSGGSFGASPLEQHIGLGKNASITKLEIWWPTSNTRQSFAQVKKDQFIQIKEFGATFSTLERKPFHIGNKP
ncbi:MAG TPA: FG-GAP-like repeat-containing protein [Terriglobales bacterium]|nr:FG-GAP-like repeat-containing protein [Terriglobales bacterium]